MRQLERGDSQGWQIPPPTPRKFPWRNDPRTNPPFLYQFSFLGHLLSAVSTCDHLCMSRLQHKDSPLLQHTWYRVVLDEAHWVRNHECATSAAVAALKAERRWCMTGTPIQNKMDDLFSLVRYVALECIVLPRVLFIPGANTCRNFL